MYSMKSILTIILLMLFTSFTGVTQNIAVKSGALAVQARQATEKGDQITAPNPVNSGIVIPNAFSPNGDGINDLFKITGIEKYPDARLFIYTASNRKVFGKDHYGNIDFWGSEDDAWWDGTNNLRGSGAPMPNGTYIYILDLANGNKASIKLGTVFIRR
jgi:gliding motility-associated-like protein